MAPAIVGEQASWRYLELSAVSIRNPNTRIAYARAASAFFGWCEGVALQLPDIQPVHVAAGSRSWEGKGAPPRP